MKMDCMEEARALKSSFCTETATKSATQQAILDDIWCVTGLPSDDFLVDDFFVNLPNEETDNKISCDKNYSENNDHEDDDDEEEDKDMNSCGSLSSGHDPVVVLDSSHFSAHLGIPDDDMQELELWSHLMDDSVPEPMLTYPKPSMDGYNKKTGFTFVNRVEPFKKHRVERASFFPTAVPVKPRSKRLRSIGNRSWFSGSPPKTESSSSSSSPQSPVSTLLFAPPVHEPGMFFMYAKPPLKKPKKKSAPSLDGENGLSSAVQRRCTHCQVTKTPQWRAGPNGPKTLCNACGVRFKSGRLFPEYRPACSPTFSSEVHSNSHRKVLEMRRQKEMTELVPSIGSAERVSSS